MSLSIPAMAVFAVLLLLVYRSLAAAPSQGRRERVEARDGQLPEAEIQALVRAGRKIEAVKLYRELHATDLRSAKEAIDRME